MAPDDYCKPLKNTLQIFGSVQVKTCGSSSTLMAPTLLRASVLKLSLKVGAHDFHTILQTCQNCWSIKMHALPRRFWPLEQTNWEANLAPILLSFWLRLTFSAQPLAVGQWHCGAEWDHIQWNIRCRCILPGVSHWWVKTGWSHLLSLVLGLDGRKPMVLWISGTSLKYYSAVAMHVNDAATGSQCVMKLENLLLASDAKGYII